MLIQESMVAARYRVERTLGAGGMATVYQVFDTTTNRSLALKRLHEQSDLAKRQRTVELFEREFHTLSHLAHPHVVEVYDYGVDDAGPYYTMELLDGGELAQLSPLPWKRACEIAAEVCSALSLVHSRRLLYRDLNPRNVHCNREGRAKLIDFGALCPIGPVKQIVGTPAYCAPETLELAALDARTDLYSLGATLYFMITGRHAYPARNFEQLRAMWEARPPRPAELVEGLPAGLDDLVMDLLHLDPSVRPASAAEVFETLAVIAGRTLQDLPAVTHAYLSAPSLVGREGTLSRIRTKIKRATRSRGDVVAFEGASGVGRSRILAAARLEAKLQGVLTLSADASDARQENGVLRALTRQLLLSAPELAIQLAEPKLRVLGRLLPELHERRPELPLDDFDDAVKFRSAALGAFRDWLLAISAQRPLLITIDDLHGADELSAAAIALLARSLENHGLLLVASVEIGATVVASGALQVFSTVAASVVLENLSLAESEQVLRSVFGDVPHVQLVTHRLHEITHGNPRDLMQLAQDLVDRGVVKFRAGWTLPTSLDDSLLPSNMAQALSDRVRSLGPLARTLGLLLTLTPDRGLSFDECSAVCEEEPRTAVSEALGELQRTLIVSYAADVYAISQRAFVPVLRADSRPDELQTLHARLALVFQRRGGEDFRRAQHLFHSGALDTALDVLVSFAIESKDRTDANADAFRTLTANLPDDWLQFLVTSVEECGRRGRPLRDAHALRLRFVGLVNVMMVPVAMAAPILRDCLRELSHAAGLDLCVSVANAADPTLAARTAIGAAHQRFEQAPDHARICPPMLALKELSRAMISTSGLVTTSLDVSIAEALPCLSDYRALSPALEIVERLRCGALARLQGRFEQARTIYQDLLVYSDRPDFAGLDVSNHRYLRCGVMAALGLMEAQCGLASCLRWAELIESEPLYVVPAFQIRMVHALWEGRVHDADKHKAHFELLRIQSAARQLADGPYLIGCITANAAGDDLTRVKQTAGDIAAMTLRFHPWNAVSEYAHGEYERIRGKPLHALQRIETALAQCAPGTNPIWPYAAGAHVQLLHSNGQFGAARRAGEKYLQQAEEHALGWHANFIRLPLALTLCELGEYASASALADLVIESFSSAGSRGLPLVLAYEARTKIALAQRDADAYERTLSQLAQHVSGGQGRGLRAKYERLKQHPVTGQVQAGNPHLHTGLTMLTGTEMRSLLVGCLAPSERAQRSLELLVRRSGALDGQLYWHRESGRVLVAQLGDYRPEPSLTQFLNDYIEGHVQDQEMSTRSGETVIGESANSWTDREGGQHHVVMLSHQTPQGFAITGLAVLRAPVGARFEPPTTLAASLSRALLDAGDVVPLIVY
jgi:hypothetical protein